MTISASTSLRTRSHDFRFRQRAVIVLRYYADLTEADIAHALQCRPGTVKSLSSRALAALSKEIKP